MKLDLTLMTMMMMMTKMMICKIVNNIVKPKVQIQNFKPKDTTITPPTNNIGYHLMFNAFSLKSWFQKVIEEHIG